MRITNQLVGTGAQAGEVAVLWVPTGRSKLQEVDHVCGGGLAEHRRVLLQAGREDKHRPQQEAARLAAFNKRDARVFIHDVIGHLRIKGNIGSTIAGYVKALKSRFIWNEIEKTGRVRIKGASESPVYESEVPPK